jgi:hypothetical protein
MESIMPKLTLEDTADALETTPQVVLSLIKRDFLPAIFRSADVERVKRELGRDGLAKIAETAKTICATV